MRLFRFSIPGARNVSVTSGDVEAGSEDTTDRALLRQYLAGSEQAFTVLMRRHVDLVYSAALRQMREPHLAEDVTQEVFVAMSRSAGKIAKEAAISAWLYNTTRYTCLNALRGGRRRRQHETRAAQMTQTTFDPTSKDDESLWQQLKPVLDDAMAKLSPADQRLIVLRYFDQRNNEQMAQMLAVHPGTLAKRTQRARDRLRNILLGYGLPVEAASLGGVLMRHAIQPSPASLLSKAATLAGAGKASASGAFAGTKGVVTIMGWTKAQVAAAAFAGAMLIGGTTYMVGDHHAETAAQAAAVPASMPSDAWKRPFGLAYSLAPGENVRCVMSPYIPERAAFFKATPMFQMGSGRHWRLIFAYVPKELAVSQMIDRKLSDDELLQRMGLLHLEDGNYLRLFGVGSSQNLSAILSSAGFGPYEVESSTSIDRVSLPGDFVVRVGIAHEQFLAELQQISARQFHRPLVFTRRHVVRNVLTMSGNFYKPGNVVSSKSMKTKFLDVFGDFQKGDDNGGTGIMMGAGFGMYLENRLHMKVENHAVDDSNKPGEYFWVGYKPTMTVPSTPPDDSLVRSTIEKLEAHTNLQFQIVPREMDIWELTVEPGATAGK
jgi:RNA polymerase sigma factor (sigma-70 family)